MPRSSSTPPETSTSFTSPYNYGSTRLRAFYLVHSTSLPTANCSSSSHSRGVYPTLPVNCSAPPYLTLPANSWCFDALPPCDTAESLEASTVSSYLPKY